MKHNFHIETKWIRRCHNEAADALSKNDMPRFWNNIKGDRTQIILKKGDLRRPAHAKQGGMRRTAAQQREWNLRPTNRPAPSIKTSKGTTVAELNNQIDRAVKAHSAGSDPRHATRSGFNHYMRFCKRTGRDNNVAPAHHHMADNIVAWMADAVQEYTDPTTGKLKKRLSTSSLPTYLSHIDHWYSIETGAPRGLLQRNIEVTRHRKLITASYWSARRQVHGITYEKLEKLVDATRQLERSTGELLRAAYTLAWFALLRPTEYMLTPLHNSFDRTRHLRAGDVTFWSGQTQLQPGDQGRPDRMIINIKQSKTDSSRLGANLVVGTTGTAYCPVRAMWIYKQNKKPTKPGPLFPGLKYSTMLKTTRHLIGEDSSLYGMHSFRVGGAQAMALAGSSGTYIMSRGRWKNIESVSRYVEATEEIKAADSAAMAKTAQQRAEEQSTISWGRHALSERESLLPQHL
jgi:hypothetical protein